MKRKVIKNISFLVLMIIIGILLLNDKDIRIFASNLSFKHMGVGTIAKSGDLFYNDIYGCSSSYLGYCSIDMYFKIYNPETGKYTDYQNIYNEFDYNKINNGTNYIEVPQYNGKDVDWIAYYKEDRGSAGISVINFYYVDYDLPKFNITCDNNILRENETTECEITADIMSDVENINCELKSEELEISDVKLNDEWTVETNDSKTTLSYVTASKTEIKNEYIQNWFPASTLIPVKAQKLEVGTFKVSTPETINITSDTISLSNCEFKDNYKEDKLDDVEVKINLETPITTPTTKKIEEKVENPKTGVEDYVLLGLLISICGICILHFTKNNIFRNF